MTTGELKRLVCAHYPRAVAVWSGETLWLIMDRPFVFSDRPGEKAQPVSAPFHKTEKEAWQDASARLDRI